MIVLIARVNRFVRVVPRLQSSPLIYMLPVTIIITLFLGPLATAPQERCSRSRSQSKHDDGWRALIGRGQP